MFDGDSMLWVYIGIGLILLFAAAVIVIWRRMRTGLTEDQRILQERVIKLRRLLGSELALGEKGPISQKLSARSRGSDISRHDVIRESHNRLGLLKNKIGRDSNAEEEAEEILSRFSEILSWKVRQESK